MEQTPITVDRAWLKHLLACLANQKYIHELAPSERDQTQEVIDIAWREGMEILNKTETLAWIPPKNARRAIWTDPCVSNGNPKYEGWAWFHKPFGTKGGWERMNHLFRADGREDDYTSWVCEDDLIFLD